MRQIPTLSPFPVGFAKPAFFAAIVAAGFSWQALAQDAGDGVKDTAASCPAPKDHEAATRALFAKLQSVGSDAAAQGVSNQLWELWTDAPNEQAQALLDQGMSRRAVFDFLGALQALDRLVAYCPDYAEGYNQRAFVQYLRRDFSAALSDLDRALALTPTHLGALSGKALSLYGLGRLEEAGQVLDEALALNPWLPERHLRAPGGPLAPRTEGAPLTGTGPEVEL